MGFFGQLGKDVAGGLDLLTTIYTKPLQTFGAVVGKGKLLTLVKETRKEKPKTIIAKTIVSAGIYSAMLLAPAYFIPKTFGAVLLGTGIAGGVIVSPKVAKFVEPTGLLEKAFRGGEIAGEVLETGKAPVDTTEALKTGGLVGAGAVLGVGAIKIIEDVLKDKPKIPDVPEFITPPDEQLITEKPIGIERETAITPQTTTITTGKKPYKRRRKKIIPSVRQSVRVNIVNEPMLKISSKKYINQEILC